MKPELSERLFIEALFERSRKKLPSETLILKNVERLTGDASTRRYYRLDTNEKSFVVCIDNPSDTNSNSFVTTQSFLDNYKVRVPNIYDMDLRKGYILEEDLGDVTLLQYLSTMKDSKSEYAIYERIINSLLDMHKIPIADIESSKIFNKQKFDFDKLHYEIKFTTDFFMKRFLKVSDENIIGQVNSLFEPICERLAGEKMVFTHRDFHSRNVMVKDDELIIIDFQDARWGIPQYDLVSVLEDCYYELDSENKKKLIEYYYSNLDSVIHGQKTFEVFMELYQDMALQRVFKAVGSFSYIYETRKDVRYIKYIGFAMEKIKNILFSNPKYAELRQVLFKYYYES